MTRQDKDTGENNKGQVGRTQVGRKQVELQDTERGEIQNKTGNIIVL